jgi:hypothetical protein
MVKKAKSMIQSNVTPLSSVFHLCVTLFTR